MFTISIHQYIDAKTRAVRYYAHQYAHYHECAVTQLVEAGDNKRMFERARPTSRDAAVAYLELILADQLEPITPIQHLMARNAKDRGRVVTEQRIAAQMSDHTATVTLTSDQAQMFLSESAMETPA